MAAKKKTPALSIGSTIVGGALPPATKAIRSSSALPAPPVALRGRVILWAPEAGITLVARYSAPPQVVGEEAASGAWEDVARPGLDPLTNYVAPGPLRVELPLMIDGWLEQRPVDAELSVLRSLGRRLPLLDERPRPPWLRVIGVMPAIPVPRTQRWVLDDLKVEEGKERVNGRVARAMATVTVKRYGPSDVRTTLSRDETARKKHTKPWLKGDTLARFAKRHLGSSEGWARTEIRKANPSVKSWSKVKIGRQLVVPRLGIAFGNSTVGGLVRGG